MVDFRLEPLAEDACLLHFGTGIDAAVNARVHAAAHALRKANLDGVVDIAPAYATLLLRVDWQRWSDAKAVAPPFARLATRLRAIIESATPETCAARGAIDIPVCYEGECAPDLGEVADHAGLTIEAAVARHAAGAYTVAMLGFAPGFPYLLGLDPALHTPRRAEPRTRVPAGSVAIGGAQTGIYPRALPGGWSLIGRTPVTLFDPHRAPPCLLAPGDRVHFRPVTRTEFARLGGTAA